MSGSDKKQSGQQYEDLKQDIDRRYPPGRFVAIESSQVIADDESHRKLVEKLRALGKSPNGMLIVQAGVDYPESALILLKELGPSGDA